MFRVVRVGKTRRSGRWEGTYRLDILSARGFARHGFAVGVYIAGLREKGRRLFIETGSSLIWGGCAKPLFPVTEAVVGGSIAWVVQVGGMLMYFPALRRHYLYIHCPS